LSGKVFSDVYQKLVDCQQRCTTLFTLIDEVDSWPEPNGACDLTIRRSEEDRQSSP
jgi:hypothetical protein